MTAERDFLLDGEDEGDDAQDDSAGNGESDGGGDSGSSDKRVRDLQSAKDKETARANKAEKENQRLKAALLDPDSEDGKPPAGGGDVSNDALLDMARMFVFQANPKLAEYGITASELSGGTPSEVAASAAELVARFEKIETRVRNKVLADNGMAPEIDAGAPPRPPRDFSTMPKEDFDKLVEEAMRGGAR